MGQHKYNPTAIAAKNGELPPKPRPMGKRARERMLFRMCQEALYGPLMAAYTRGCLKERNGNNETESEFAAAAAECGTDG